jgi:hypothetical protein
VGRIALIEKVRNAYKILIERPGREIPRDI